MKSFRTLHSRVLLVAAVFLPGFAFAQEMCPVTGGSTFCASGATSQSPATSTGAGNPIDVTSGNKYQREVDFQYPGELGLGLMRHYNSNGAGGRAFGAGWTHSFETRLTRSQTGGRVLVTIVQSDGRTLQFREQAAGATGTTSYRDTGGQQGIIDEDSRALERLRRIRDGQGSALDVGGIGGLTPWVWRWPDGRRLTFDGRGRLRQVALVNGARLVAEYDGTDRLVSVRDDAGRAMQVSYWDDAAERLESFGVSRRATIRGKRGQLKNVTLPDGRELTYGYDESGMLNAVRMPDGALRRYEYRSVGGMARLTRVISNDEVVGEYGYDDYGRANYSAARGNTVKLDFRSADRDGLGGATQVVANGGAETIYRWRASPGTSQRLIVEATGPGCDSCPVSNVRQRLDAAGRLVAFEHLAPGKRRGTTAVVSSERYRYDSLGRVTERVAVDARGREKLLARLSYESDDPWAQPVLIERPSSVAGRMHRVKVTYDSSNRIVAAEESGFAPALEATPGHAATSAHELRRGITLRHERRGARLVLKEVDGPLPGRDDILHFEWDEHGVTLARVRYPLGIERSWTFDPASDRLLQEVPEDGVPVNYLYDARGLLTARSRGDAVIQIHNDERGRSDRFSLPDGEVLHVAYDGPGASAALLSNRGIARWLRPPQAAVENSHAVAPAADTGIPIDALGDAAPGWGNTELVFDDFGRVIAAHTSATGQERFAYDEADRLVERRFADGTIWDYSRDALGRIVSHRRNINGEAARDTRLSYSGYALAAVDDSSESVRVASDATGRTSARTVTRQHASGAKLRYSERLYFDASGRLTEHALPEGGALLYGWRIGNELASVTYRDESGGLTTLISAGSTHGFTYGNGVSYVGTVGKDGRLERFEYRLPDAAMTASGNSLLPSAHASSGARNLIDVRLEFDPLGRLSARHEIDVTRRYAYDDLGRLVIVDEGASGRDAQYFAYNLRGDLLSRRVGGATQKFDFQAIVRGAGGLPVRAPSPLGARELTYSADRRLTEVRAGHQLIARYEHNAHGERISKTVFTTGEPTTTGFYYLDNRLVGESAPGDPGRISRRYVYAQNVPIAVIDYPSPRALDRQPEADESEAGMFGSAAAWLRGSWENLVDGRPRITFIHGNEIGTPIAATDAKAKLVWSPEYLAYGAIRAHQRDTDFSLNLRLPGQYHDAETGWHDNYLRTYDPARGQYLEPDPLGPVPNMRFGRQLTQPYAYVNHDPLLNADPMGLVLFPFDGTANDRNDRTNVLHFATYYAAFNDFDRAMGVTGMTYYINGVQTEGWLNGDGPVTGGAFASQLRERVDRGLNYLDNYLNGYMRWERDRREQLGLPPLSADNPIVIDIDTVGFSRGAATAREFINRVLDRMQDGYYERHNGGCVTLNLRMMALFETVLSSNTGDWWGGTPFRMVIPDEVDFVAQAVAVNEHRRSFPVELVYPSQAALNAPQYANRVERGFVGAHSDIGGGYNGDPNSDEEYDGGDLSDVALNWMVQQAAVAGVQMNPLPEDLRRVTNPILHDPRRAAIWTEIMQERGSDRDVRFRGWGDRNNTDNMAWTRMREVVLPGGMSTDRSMPFIVWRDLGILDFYTTAVGDVRICDYAQWLNSNYGMSWTCQ